MRIGRAEIEPNPNGIYLGGAFLETLNLIVVLSREKLPDLQISAFRIGLDMADGQALTGMDFVWINTQVLVDSNGSRPAAVTCAWPCASRVWAWSCNL